MKWNGLGRGFKAVAASLALGLGMTACSSAYTVGYLYVTAARQGLINAYGIDSQSGALYELADSPIPSSARTNSNPVAIAAAPNAKTIYVVNHDSSEVVQFAVGTDGKIFAQTTYPVVLGANGVTGTTPTAAAVDPTGSYLAVAFTYQNGFTTVRPGPGGVAIYPIVHSTDPAVEGTLKSPLVNTTIGTTADSPLPYLPVGNNPAGVTFSTVTPPGTGGAVATTGTEYLYVIDQERPAVGSPFGVLLAFQVTAPTSGTPIALGTPTVTAIPGPVAGGFSAGTSPAGIVEEQRGRFLYVTDQATNQLFGYQTVAGVPTPLVSSPFNTGSLPLGVTVDPRGRFLYVANFNSGTVSVFNINASDGSLAGSAGIVGTGVRSGPTCVTVEPALGIYLYTSNNTDNSVSGEQLDPSNGTLRDIQGTPYATQALPTCAVAIPAQGASTQLVN